MPKPSFFQSVLRKPTQSYASPSRGSPFAEIYNDYEYDYDRPSMWDTSPAARQYEEDEPGPSRRSHAVRTGTGINGLRGRLGSENGDDEGSIISSTSAYGTRTLRTKSSLASGRAYGQDDDEAFQPEVIFEEEKVVKTRRRDINRNQADGDQLRRKTQIETGHEGNYITNEQYEEDSDPTSEAETQPPRQPQPPRASAISKVNKPRKVKSISFQEPIKEEQEYMPTRFPKPAKKSHSSVELRNGQLVEVRPLTGTSLGMMAGKDQIQGVKAKKKKKVKRNISEDGSSIITTSSQAMSASKIATPRTTSIPKPANRVPATQSQFDSQRDIIPAPKQITSSSTPLNIHQAETGKHPESSRSSSIVEDYNPAGATNARTELRSNPDTLKRSSTVKSDRTLRQQSSGEFEEDFFTPLTSPRNTLTVPPTITLPQENGESQASMPRFTVQPPTPAPQAEPEKSPFPTLGPPLNGSETKQRPRLAIHQAESAPNVMYPDTQSDSGEAGSDGEEPNSVFEGSAASLTHSRQTSFSQPTTAPSLMTDPNPKLQSRNSPRSSMSQPDLSRERRFSKPMSEISYGGRSAREGSIRSSFSQNQSIAGYGKGGWAAAAMASESASQSGRNSPRMFLPSGGNSGWADFQVPIQPARQSKFTPLPPRSQATFDRLLNGDSHGGSQGPGSLRSEEYRSERSVPVNAGEARYRSMGSNGGGEAFLSNGNVRENSEPSDYSDEDEFPRPSRSYANGQPMAEEYADKESAGPMEASRPYSPPIPPPRDPRRPSVVPKMPSPLSPVSPVSEQYSSNSASPYGNSGRFSPPLENHRSPYLHLNIPMTQGGSHHGSNRDTVSESPLESQQDLRDSSDPPTRSQSGTDISRPLSPTLSLSASQYEREGGGQFPRPSFLDPDVLTILPEMTHEDSEKLYRAPSQARSKSALGQPKAQSVVGDYVKRSSSVLGGDERNEPRRSKSVLGMVKNKSEKWEGSSAGDGVLLKSDGTESERVGGYTNLVVPMGAYVPSKPDRKQSGLIDPRILGLPTSTMASLVLSHSAHRLHMTPHHLRHDAPSPVDFASYLKPPSKVGSKEILVQIYAVAVDEIDVRSIEEKNKGDVGKWVPGRSFVGRCLSAGAEEKEIGRGEIVVGLLDVRKSGALAEFIVVDRRRVTRAPFPTSLTLEQLALLPLQAVPAIRVIRGNLTKNSRAIIMDAHTGVSALICQELSRAGVSITALIGGGDNHHDAQTRCLQNGARGVLTGSPAAIMFGLHEDEWDFVVDTKGGDRVYDAAKRILREGGKIVTLVEPDKSLPAGIRASAKSSGWSNFKAAFGSKKRGIKSISFDYVCPPGSGEPEVDQGGMDIRDILEEPCVAGFRPHVDTVFAFEKGGEAFKSSETSVIRIIN